uniref:Uncharacterized protein n=1 Tax=Anas platyrhynchos platyrhynchos TaxID=8840 RepID=A0A493ST62_ANAPP
APRPTPPRPEPSPRRAPGGGETRQGPPPLGDGETPPEGGLRYWGTPRRGSGVGGPPEGAQGLGNPPKRGSDSGEPLEGTQGGWGTPQKGFWGTPQKGIRSSGTPKRGSDIGEPPEGAQGLGNPPKRGLDVGEPLKGAQRLGFILLGGSEVGEPPKRGDWGTPKRGLRCRGIPSWGGAQMLGSLLWGLPGTSMGVSRYRGPPRLGCLDIGVPSGGVLRRWGPRFGDTQGPPTKPHGSTLVRLGPHQPPKMGVPSPMD